MENRTWINGYPFIAYPPTEWNEAAAVSKARAFFEEMNTRRSVREFSTEPFSVELINDCLRAASTAPSGANKQPWTFCVISDPELKSQIRKAAEEEEFESYHHRMNDEWLADIKSLQTDWHKPFLEDAPYLIAVFKKVYDLQPDGSKRNNYYVNESVGLACGFLLAALHRVGLAALTHTPNPMNFLSRILQRPENERPFLLIPVGRPHPSAVVPDQSRKPLHEIAVYYGGNTNDPLAK
jgi:nitroreductase